MRRAIYSLIVVAAALTACSPKPKLTCASDAAQSTTISLIKDELEKAVLKNLTSDTPVTQVSKASIRASVSQLIIALTDIRTTKEDPNSTKKFCTANLSVRVPSDMLADAEKARSDAEANNVSALADQNDINRSAETFSAGFDYDVQPTDDGKKVYSGTESMPKFSSFFGELVASSLLKSRIEQAHLEAQQQVAAQQAQQQAAATEQRNADLSLAKTDNQLANQTITAVWRNVPPDTRAEMLESQRGWIRSKTASCNVVAAGASTDATEQETARLRCDTKATQERTQFLQQYATNGADSGQ
jgi:uncharacterized protein YecT (DUF1311 family)